LFQEGDMEKGRVAYLGVFVLVFAMVAVFLQFLQPGTPPIYWVIRIAALMGYFCVFGAIVTSAYMRQMVRWFGRPFLKVHHTLSVTGLILTTIHPLAVAWQALSLRVFIPAVDSWYGFFAFGGRAAWYLLGIGALVAVLRGAVGKNWRLLHYLNYLAFWLATVHGILIGANVQNWVMRLVFGAMASGVLGVFVQKRTRARRRK
jgi:sulfoxide reductase heme-binding subunit YedZ